MIIILWEIQISRTFPAFLHLSLNNHSGFSGHSVSLNSVCCMLCVCMCLQVSELQKELSELEKCNWELEDDVEMRKAAHTEEISGLEVWEGRHQRSVHLFSSSEWTVYPSTVFLSLCLGNYRWNESPRGRLAGADEGAVWRLQEAAGGEDGQRHGNSRLQVRTVQHAWKEFYHVFFFFYHCDDVRPCPTSIFHTDNIWCVC